MKPMFIQKTMQDSSMDTGWVTAIEDKEGLKGVLSVQRKRYKTGIEEKVARLFIPTKG